MEIMKKNLSSETITAHYLALKIIKDAKALEKTQGRYVNPRIFEIEKGVLSEEKLDLLAKDGLVPAYKTNEHTT